MTDNISLAFLSKVDRSSKQKQKLNKENNENPTIAVMIIIIELVAETLISISSTMTYSL